MTIDECHYDWPVENGLAVVVSCGESTLDVGRAWIVSPIVLAGNHVLPRGPSSLRSRVELVLENIVDKRVYVLELGPDGSANDLKSILETRHPYFRDAEFHLPEKWDAS